MRTSSALLLVIAGFSQWGCGDSASGPGLGPLTSWQFNCSDDSTSCGSLSTDPHGPIDGNEADLKNDDEKLKVTCKEDNGGYSITLTDPGRDLADPKYPKQAPARAGSILTITNAVPSSNKCVVQLNETLRSGTPYHLIETCTGTKTTLSGNCELTGGPNKADGYDFEGTLQCPGMHLNNTPAPDYKLGAGKDPDSPIQLQIVHCS